MGFTRHEIWREHFSMKCTRAKSDRSSELFPLCRTNKTKSKIHMQRKKHPWKSFLVFVALFFKEILFTLILRAHLFNLLLIFCDSYSNSLGTCIVFMVYLEHRRFCFDFVVFSFFDGFYHSSASKVRKKMKRSFFSDIFGLIERRTIEFCNC